MASTPQLSPPTKHHLMARLRETTPPTSFLLFSRSISIGASQPPVCPLGSRRQSVRFGRPGAAEVHDAGHRRLAGWGSAADPSGLICPCNAGVPLSPIRRPPDFVANLPGPGLLPLTESRSPAHRRQFTARGATDLTPITSAQGSPRPRSARNGMGGEGISGRAGAGRGDSVVSDQGGF